MRIALQKANDRTQFDTSGIARIFTQDSKKAFYKHFLHTGFPVESSLHNVLDNHLGAEVSAGTISTKQDALDYLTWTFFFRRLHKNPSYYGLEISAEEHNTIAAQQMANDYMISMVDKSLGELAESNCLEMYPNGDVDSTSMGKIMSYYYLSHRTIRHLVKHAKRSASFADVLSWMSSATEYDELPVRHNEDLINAELSKNLPLPASAFDNLPMWDPHVKAFLLLQSHMSRIDLPITDYVGDQTSVLDQAIRIIQASIDVLTELGYLSSCMQMITLLQCIKCARWPADYPLSILPGVPVEIPSKDNVPLRLQDFSAQSEVDYQRTLSAFHIPPGQTSRFQKASLMIPNVRVGVENVNALSLTVYLNRLNALTDRDGKVYAPRFPKSQTEGWFVLLCQESSDEIIAIKRVGWSSGSSKVLKNSTRAVMKFPEEESGGYKDGRKIDVWVASDAYVGMVYKVQNIEVPDVPKVPLDGKKEKSGKMEVAGVGGPSLS